jgi:hypothetical protein
LSSTPFLALHTHHRSGANGFSVPPGTHRAARRLARRHALLRAPAAAARARPPRTHGCRGRRGGPDATVTFIAYGCWITVLRVLSRLGTLAASLPTSLGPQTAPILRASHPRNAPATFETRPLRRVGLTKRQFGRPAAFLHRPYLAQTPISRLSLSACPPMPIFIRQIACSDRTHTINRRHKSDM